MPCPLHSPGHPPLGHHLSIDDGVALLEGDLVTVCSSVVKLGYVVGATLNGRGKGGGERGGEEGEGRRGEGKRGEGEVESGLEWEGSGRGVGWSKRGERRHCCLKVVHTHRFCWSWRLLVNRGRRKLGRWGCMK